MPTQDGVGRDDGADLGERFPAQGLCLRGQPSALIIVEPEPLASELLFQDPVFLAEILDDALLLIREHPRENHAEQLPRLEDVRHASRLQRSLQSSLWIPRAEFLCTHWESIAATDFFTVETWTLKGLTRFHVLFVIDLSTRRVEIAGISDRPHGAWVQRVMRRLLDDFDGFLRPHRFLIHDRDPLFTNALTELLRAAGIEPVKPPPRSPNLNAYAERFIRSIKSECLGRIIPIGERHQRCAIDEYIEHYNQDRPHQGLGNELIDPPDRPPTTTGAVTCEERLGGLLRSYSRAA